MENATKSRRELESLPPPDKRDEVRALALAKVPRWYNPYVHLAVPSVFALLVIAVSVSMLHQVTTWELLTIPVLYLFNNASEWRIHRDLLHTRSAFAPVLYDRHTPEHHMIYVTEDMAMRDRKEFRLVLIPAYGLFLIFVSLLPLVAAIWFLGFRNIALLYVATAIGYAASYEWLHLSYHLPRESWIGNRALIRLLRRHHAIHHDPRLMQRYNFNVTLPLWDWVRGTLVTDRAAVLSKTSQAAQTP